MSPIIEDLPNCARKCESCVVRDQAICRAMSPEELKLIDPFSHTRHCHAGEVLIYQGDSVNFFGTVKRGLVTRWQSMPDGRSQLLDIIFPGGHVGSVEMVKSSSEIRCSSPVELCLISGNRIRSLLTDIPKMETHLRQLREKELEETRLHLMRLGVMNARERIVSFLDKVRRVNQGLYESEILATHTKNWLPSSQDHKLDFDLPLYLKRGDIAHYLGLTIETVSRKLAELKEEGIIAAIQGQNLRLNRQNFTAALAEQEEA